MTYLDTDVFKVMITKKNSIALLIDNTMYYYNIADPTSLFRQFSYPTKTKGYRQLKNSLLDYLKDFEVTKEDFF